MLVLFIKRNRISFDVNQHPKQQLSRAVGLKNETAAAVAHDRAPLF